jgi:hypothetical protein
VSDEHLRDLERRWRATGALADRLALLRERARVLDDPGARHRLAVHDFDPAAARAAVTAVLHRHVPALEAEAAAHPDRIGQPDPSGVRRRLHQALVVDLDRALAASAGSWFEGLGRGLGMERWCACHRLFARDEVPRAAGVPAAADNVTAHVVEMQGVHAGLLELFDAISLPVDDASASAVALGEALRRLIEFVIHETGCDDAWYEKPAIALRLLAQDKGLVLPPGVLGDVERAFSASFQSWIEPADEVLAATADDVALTLVRSLFEERYGAP